MSSLKKTHNKKSVHIMVNILCQINSFLSFPKNVLLTKLFKLFGFQTFRLWSLPDEGYPQKRVVHTTFFLYTLN